MLTLISFIVTAIVITVIMRRSDPTPRPLGELMEDPRVNLELGVMIALMLITIGVGLYELSSWHR